MYIQKLPLFTLILFVVALFYSPTAVDSAGVNMNTSVTEIETFLETNGEIYTVQKIENIIYIGGNFSEVNRKGDQSIQRRNIAAYDTAADGFTEWNPNINGTVRSLAADYNTVYIAGDFTEINAQQRNYVAAFDKSTGQLTSWSPQVNQPIRTLVVNGTKMYLFSQAELGSEYVSSVDISGSLIPMSNVTPFPNPQGGGGIIPVVSGGTVDLGFTVPNFSDILTFFLRGFFVIAGIVALFYLLMGAFNWITSGGDKDAVASARNKIQSAIVGLIMMVAVLTLVVTLEQMVFSQQICLGISCPATIPALIQPS